MRKNKVELYLHLVWTTWDRQPWILEGVERRLYREIEHEMQQMDCTVIALNGTKDHVHLLVRFATTVTIAELLKQVKGSSSRFVNEVMKPTEHFRWQPNYGAFTVSATEVEEIKTYIQHQKRHHAMLTAIEAYEETLEELTEV